VSTSEIGKDFLNHYGTKGMKWGVRRAAKKVAKADKKWEKSINSVSTFVAVNNRAADLANNIDVPRINNSKKYRDVDFNVDSPLRRAYYKDHEDAFNKRIVQAANEIIGTNPSGTKKIHIDIETGVTSLVDVEHARFTAPTLKFDSTGHIVAFVVEDVLEQTTLVGLEFLEHYGTKGMKWGVRKRRNESKRARTFGGSGKKAKDPLESLSDKELQQIVTRMNLEQNYKRLTQPKQSNTLKKVLATGATINGVIAFANSPAGKAIKAGLSKTIDTSSAISTIGR
jgi:hypothetical protein